MEDLGRGISLGGAMVVNFVGVIITYDFYPVWRIPNTAVLWYVIHHIYIIYWFERMLSLSLLLCCLCMVVQVLIQIEETQEGLFTFLTSLCAIIGGVITIMRCGSHHPNPIQSSPSLCLSAPYIPSVLFTHWSSLIPALPSLSLSLFSEHVCVKFDQPLSLLFCESFDRKEGLISLLIRHFNKHTINKYA